MPIVKPAAMFATNTSSLAVIDQAAVDEPPGPLPRAALLQPGPGDEADRGGPGDRRPRRGIRGRASSSRVSQGKLATTTRDTRGIHRQPHSSFPTCSTRSAPIEEGVGSIEEIDAGDEGRSGAPDGAARALGLRRSRHARSDLRRACTTSTASAASRSRRPLRKMLERRVVREEERHGLLRLLGRAAGPEPGIDC